MIHATSGSAVPSLSLVVSSCLMDRLRNDISKSCAGIWNMEYYMGTMIHLLGNQHEVVVCGCLGRTDALTKSTELDFGYAGMMILSDSFISAHSPIQPSHPRGGGITDLVGLFGFQKSDAMKVWDLRHYQRKILGFRGML